MGIDVTNKGFEPNFRPLEQAPEDSSSQVVQTPNAETASMASTALAALTGTALNAGFYCFAYATPWEPLKRYFLGHPVAIAARILFWFAVAVLLTKWLDVLHRCNCCDQDEDLCHLPRDITGDRWLTEQKCGLSGNGWKSCVDYLARLGVTDWWPDWRSC